MPLRSCRSEPARRFGPQSTAAGDWVGTYCSRLCRAPLTALRAVRTRAALCQALTGNASSRAPHRVARRRAAFWRLWGLIDGNARIR